MKEGLCTNCGSLMRINENDPEGITYCIFCHAPVKNQEALDLMEDSEGYEFPNETYREPTAEEKAKAFESQGLGGIQVVNRSQQRKPTVRKEGRLTPREKVALQNKPLVKPYCSKKHRIAIAVGSLAFVLVIAAIALPVYFTRENKKAELMEEIPERLSISQTEERVSIQKQNNSGLILVSEEAVTEDKAREIFDDYSALYAEVYGIEPGKAEQKIRVKVVDQESGGYEVKTEKEEVKVHKLGQNS